MIHVPGPPPPRPRVRLRGARSGLVLATRSTGDGASPVIYFHYHDEIRRDEGGRRFSSRRLLLRFRSTT